jgi:Domain of unknown function (DUF4338)
MSRILALCEKRIPDDWEKRFAHQVLLLETFVDPARFQGTVYKAANWTLVGTSKGYRRVTTGYANRQSPKMVFVKPMKRDARSHLCRAALEPEYCTGAPKLKLTADQMYALPGSPIPVEARGSDTA